MKACPQCSSVYDDDYVFCLTDGNALLEDEGEQETVVVQRFSMPQIEIGSDTGVFCVSCGKDNKPNSKFCKKCGGPITAQNVNVQSPQLVGDQVSLHESMIGSQSYQGSQHRYKETNAFQSPVFRPPPVSLKQNSRTDTKKNQTIILIAAVAVGVAIVVGAVVYSSRADANKSGSNSLSSGNRKTVAGSASAKRNGDAGNTDRSPNVGRFGHLTTNQRIRSDSNRYAEILGVHYQGARIEVSEERSFNTEDGSYVTWYRVRILENGCDVEGRLGCGNDRDGISGQAANEGWMNAKYISLD